MSSVNVTVTVDASYVISKLQNVIDDDWTMTMVNAQLAQILDPYVPYDTGFLSQESVEIEADGIYYTAYYAWRQYYGDDFSHNTEVHPLATSRWDEVAMQTHYNEFTEDVKEIIIRRYNNGQE